MMSRRPVLMAVPRLNKELNTVLQYGAQMLQVTDP